MTHPSPYRCNVTRHQSIKHRTQKEEVDDQPIEEQLTDWELMEALKFLKYTNCYRE